MCPVKIKLLLLIKIFKLNLLYFTWLKLDSFLHKSKSKWKWCLNSLEYKLESRVLQKKVFLIFKFKLPCKLNLIRFSSHFKMLSRKTIHVALIEIGLALPSESQRLPIQDCRINQYNSVEQLSTTSMSIIRQILFEAMLLCASRLENFVAELLCTYVHMPSHCFSHVTTC